MKRAKFTLRKKAVVSLYVDQELWYQFGEECKIRNTTRGMQIKKCIETLMKRWKKGVTHGRNKGA